MIAYQNGISATRRPLDTVDRIIGIGSASA